MRSRRNGVGLFLVATGAGSILAVVGLGGLLWRVTPLQWRQYLEVGDGTLPLLILFLGVPLILAALAAGGFVLGALLVSRVVSREDAERALRALPSGGDIGSVERYLLSKFTRHAGTHT